MKNIFCICIALAIILMPAAAGAFNYVLNDFNFYPIPNVARPAKGVPYIDPVFHTTITRITDAPTDVPASINYAQPGYAKHNIENADGTKLAIQSFSYPYWHIWNANPPFNKIKDIPISIAGNDIDPDVRWDNADPNILYTTFGSKMYKFNVATDEITLLHDFKNDFPSVPVSRVYTAEEGNPSDDMRYWAFMVKNYDANHNPTWWVSDFLVYDKDFYEKDNGKVISTLSSADPKWRIPNFISMSPSGNYVWVGAPPSYIYPRDFSSVREITTHGHVAITLDNQGKEVLVDSVIDPVTGSDIDWARLSDIETGEQWLLAPLGKDGGQHWSGVNRDKPGWVIYSNYFPAYPETPDEWNESSVFMVELTRKANLKCVTYCSSATNISDHARIWRLAHTHMVRKDYTDDPFAKFNKKGTKVFFGSGWGQSYADPGAQYDVYQIDLPATWYQDLTNYTPDITPPASPTGVIIN